MFRMCDAGALFPAFALFIIQSAAAQQPTSSISGRVTSVTGDPLSGVVVRVENAPSGVLTDAQGVYRLPNVSTGNVVLLAQHIGYEQGRRTVSVNAGANAVDFRLTESAVRVDAVVVTASGAAQRQMESSTATGVLTGPELRLAKASHPSELIGRVPGALVTIAGSGEGHMTAIRQPITTSPVYLFLEDGVPTRSTGFFNHNALYEVNVPQAGRIEVLKGPGTALYGSDAIGGVINVETRAPMLEPGVEYFAEAGGHGWTRALFSAGGTRGADGVRADLNITRWSGWRQETGYHRQSATLRWDHAFTPGRQLKTIASWSSIDQIDPSPLTRSNFLTIPESNDFPIATRDVRAFRVQSALQLAEGRTNIEITPFARWNELSILPNWMLNFDPVYYTTGHKSAGAIVRARRELPALRSNLTGGVDVEYSPGSRIEYAITTTRDGATYTSYQKGELIYDYDVTFHGASPYLQLDVAPIKGLHLNAGLRYDHVGFSYRSNLAALGSGAHRRPADTDVNYDHLSPKLGFAWELGPALGLFASYRHSFRSPSEGQLFRQGSALSTVDLDPIRAEQTEVGARGLIANKVDYEVNVYQLRVLDDVLTYVRPDNQREVQNAGQTRHRGIELGLGYEVAKWLRLDGSYSRTNQEYVSWQPRSTISYDGNDVQLAPRELANVRALFRPGFLTGSQFSLEWLHVGPYWEDPENTSRYEGHNLLNARAALPVRDGIEIVARMINITDRRYAENATFTATEKERLTPGSPRMIYLGVQGALPRGGR